MILSRIHERTTLTITQQLQKLNPDINLDHIGQDSYCLLTGYIFRFCNYKSLEKYPAFPDSNHSCY